MDSERDNILALISAHIESRGGMTINDYVSDWRDTIGRAAYNQDRREVLRQLHDARTMLAAIRWRSIDADALKYAFRHAFSGRLSYENGRLEYCTGQYYPTEYRAAACAVLAMALRRYWREQSGGNWRNSAIRELSPGIIRRWFN